MSQVDYTPIHHLGEALLQDAAVRVRINAIAKNDPSVIDEVTYVAAHAAAVIAVQIEVDAEIAFHNSLAPLSDTLRAAKVVTDTAAAKAAIVVALGAKALV
jgi:hypothetical protein